MNEVIKALESQRTTRRGEFSDKSIDPRDIETVKAAVLKTANASNRQSYSIIVLDREKAKSLGFPGDRVFIFCVDFNRLHLFSQKLGRDFDSGYPMQFITAMADIAMLAQSTILAAGSLGIGTLITNEVYHKDPDALFTALNIPEKRVFPMLAVCLGYSETNKKPPKGRLGPACIFHDNAYRDSTETETEDLIAAYDDGGMALISDWREKGYAHYLEWFFDKWCPVIGSRKQSDILIESLKKHGMI
jgi:FMN reductase [NAD(P)H]